MRTSGQDTIKSRTAESLNIQVQPASSNIAQSNDDETIYGFRNDVVGGKIAMIHFIFTTGATVCPTQSVTFFKMQTVLGDRFVERSDNLSARLCARTLIFAVDELIADLHALPRLSIQQLKLYGGCDANC